jgi:hypothetical protein
MAVTNTLAHNDMATITAVKCFYCAGPGALFLGIFSFRAFFPGAFSILPFFLKMNAKVLQHGERFILFCPCLLFNF